MMLPSLRRARSRYLKETPPPSFVCCTRLSLSLFLLSSSPFFPPDSWSLSLSIVFIPRHASRGAEASCIRLRTERVEYLPSLEASPTFSLYPLFPHPVFISSSLSNPRAPPVLPSSLFSRSATYALVLPTLFFLSLSFYIRGSHDNTNLPNL